MDWIKGKKSGRVSVRTYVLVAALVATLFSVHSMDEKGKAARARARAVVSTPQAPAAAALASRNREPLEAGAVAGWGRDPFTRSFHDRGDDDGVVRAGSALVANPAAAGLYLQGVMVGATGRTALINGEVCREGDRVGLYEVLSIGKRSAMLIRNGSVTTLTLKGDGS
jgi:hypothetical protein